MAEYTYSIICDDEFYDESYSSRSKALDAGKIKLKEYVANYEDGLKTLSYDDYCVYTAQIVRPRHADLMPSEEELRDMMSDKAEGWIDDSDCNMVGDTDKWLHNNQIDREAKIGLFQKVSIAIADWIKDHDLQPKFFYVTDVKFHNVADVKIKEDKHMFAKYIVFAIKADPHGGLSDIVASSDDLDDAIDLATKQLKHVVKVYIVNRDTWKTLWERINGSDSVVTIGPRKLLDK